MAVKKKSVWKEGEGSGYSGALTLLEDLLDDSRALVLIDVALVKRLSLEGRDLEAPRVDGRTDQGTNKVRPANDLLPLHLLVQEAATPWRTFRAEH